jgi:hypothetical protein
MRGRGGGGAPPVRLKEGKRRVAAGLTKGREGAGRRRPGARQGRASSACAMQGRAVCSCARAAHWADSGANLLGVELGSGELRQDGEQRRPSEVGEARRRTLKAATKLRVRAEVGDDRTKAARYAGLHGCPDQWGPPISL